HDIRPQGNRRDNQPEEQQIALQQLRVFDRVPFEEHVAHRFVIKSDFVKNQYAVGGKPAGVIFDRRRRKAIRGYSTVINSEGFAIRVVNDSGQYVRLCLERLEDVLGGLRILKGQR